MRGIVVVHPFKTGRYEIELVQRWRGFIKLVQVAHQPLHAGMLRVVEQVPVQALVVVPFAHLRKFAAHEQQLFAGMAEHEAQISAHVGELLPSVTGHLAQQRAFAMHHFVMRNRQHEVLAEGVAQAKRHFALMVLAMHRVARHVLQRVVHPAHVPFVVKAQSARRRGARHGRKRGRLFGHRDGLRPLGADDLVQAFQKGDGFQVLAAAVDVGNPFAGLAAVVAVKHRRHRIDAQPINPKTLQPVQRIANQKIAHFGAAQVVDQRVPVVVEPLTRVGVFVQRRAVKITQSVGVGRKMRRHPVEQHAHACPMAARDKAHQTVGIAKPRGRRIQADRLITPGAVKRIFADRQQFNVREPHIKRIGHQLLGHLVPGQPALQAAFAVMDAPPGTWMHFINAHGRIQRVGLLAQL